ncbi:hypothetical protein VP409E501_P0069 [Vibrio phage 409E50-1]|nr:hypothetical protein VP521E561_P0069 [Vibrio phage 521E56-1]CAH9012999.1 hypothetical protein VP384E501_P0069 [Vibrio phage 384E50-1]CAH9013037.1 hypothetical protein VP409E501_P0069 [Vibrio phage 409E50-1]CAH9013068.1 hypothetical protein VP402E501_P0069 [Vibrio phage 402E50-1]CAH9013805.1 hypothetical protein VP405E501_P0069 [Vibrio phage 405E50-1]CAH9013858.1 hypothetical protein VP413E501_P0069 [Vibrio phage 413E50-1]CAH9016119.1 hypothetical protein VP468E531_P0068 [Vibrio phage 468E5
MLLVKRLFSISCSLKASYQDAFHVALIAFL